MGYSNSLFECFERMAHYNPIQMKACQQYLGLLLGCVIPVLS